MKEKNIVPGQESEEQQTQTGQDQEQSANPGVPDEYDNYCPWG